MKVMRLHISYENSDRVTVSYDFVLISSPHVFQAETCQFTLISLLNDYR